ncbi:MAG: hypothetical protein KDB68_15170 [Planctomycetes bacterium]|nr:hypothetical protein [Planctomycetota bacterium]
MRQLPHMNELAAKPGLHVVGLYSQVHTLEQIERVIEKNKITYPITTDSDIFVGAGYTAASLPKIWIIGVEGKVIFIGDRDYDELLEKELAKVKYPGLGRADFHKDLEPAAKAFGEGKYAEAYKLAEAIYDDTEDEKAEEDADYIMERIDDRLGTLVVRAETAEVVKDYQLAINCWKQIDTHYAGLDDAEEAPERLKKLADSNDVKKDIGARRDLLKLMLSLDVAFQTVDQEDAAAVQEFRKKCLAEYREFHAKNKGNSAGDKAENLIEIFENLLPAEDKPVEEKPAEEKPGEK